MEATNKGLVGVEQFSRMTGLHVCTVRRMCRTGRIPAVKVGRKWLIGLDKALGAVL
ncbi:helix-turn-helix domain-containing protein [Gordonibacter pamelaeae]|uniref:helix-turn-helix domain-containing protein n=1 Tax=Gordonibacter pamelaeae TaxID=471189 RepID=UPI003A8D8348